MTMDMDQETMEAMDCPMEQDNHCKDFWMDQEIMPREDTLFFLVVEDLLRVGVLL